MAHDELALQPLLVRMPRRSRTQLVTSLRNFAAVGEEPAGSDLWLMGWPTGSAR